MTVRHLDCFQQPDAATCGFQAGCPSCGFASPPIPLPLGEEQRGCFASRGFLTSLIFPLLCRVGHFSGLARLSGPEIGYDSSVIIGSP